MLVKELVKVLKKQRNQGAPVIIAESLFNSDDVLIVVNRPEEPMSLDNTEIYLQNEL